MQTIEQRVAETILQEEQEITISGRTYKVAPPSTATLIMVSRAISTLPKTELSSENIVTESLAIAKDCEALGEIASILILGAKRLNKYGILSRYFGLKKLRLKSRILEDLAPSELNNLIAQILKNMEIGDFFGLTTFLQEVNLLSQKKVEN